MEEKVNDQVEVLAEQLHIWYLEATKKLDPENFNSKAQKQYKDLNDEQKFIDRYIAEKVLEQVDNTWNKEVMKK